jgi:predicted transcriptional regulator
MPIRHWNVFGPSGDVVPRGIERSRSVYRLRALQIRAVAMLETFFGVLVAKFSTIRNGRLSAVCCGTAAEEQNSLFIDPLAF